MKEWEIASEENKEEARERYISWNKTSKEKVAIAKQAASENLYDELNKNGPKIIHRLAKTRHRRSKDIDKLTEMERSCLKMRKAKRYEKSTSMAY